MTTEEKIQELAQILVEMLPSLFSAVPQNHKAHIEYLMERAEDLAQQ